MKLLPWLKLLMCLRIFHRVMNIEALEKRYREEHDELTDAYYKRHEISKEEFDRRHLEIGKKFQEAKGKLEYDVLYDFFKDQPLRIVLVDDSWIPEGATLEQEVHLMSALNEALALSVNAGLQPTTFAFFTPPDLVLLDRTADPDIVFKPELIEDKPVPVIRVWFTVRREAFLFGPNTNPIVFTADMTDLPKAFRPMMSENNPTYQEKFFKDTIKEGLELFAPNIPVQQLKNDWFIHSKKIGGMVVDYWGDTAYFPGFLNFDLDLESLDRWLNLSKIPPGMRLEQVVTSYKREGVEPDSRRALDSIKVAFECKFDDVYEDQISDWEIEKAIELLPRYESDEWIGV